MLNRQSIIIKRHKNPVGIFARVIIYPLMGFGLWQHDLSIILIGVILEILNWTAIWPVKKTFAFIDKVVEKELDWLGAPTSGWKLLSFVLLGVFPVLVAVGLWFHWWPLLAISVVVIMVFQLLMTRILERCNKGNPESGQTKST